MQQFLNSQAGVYTVMFILSALGGALLKIVHSAILRIEQWVGKQFPTSQANQVNDWLNVIDKLAASAVQDANSRIVLGLKQNGLFTKETADSVKQAVVADVLASIGPMKEQIIGTLGPLDRIIGQMVEANVLKYKATSPSSTVTTIQTALNPLNQTRKE